MASNRSHSTARSVMVVVIRGVGSWYPLLHTRIFLIMEKLGPFQKGAHKYFRSLWPLSRDCTYHHLYLYKILCTTVQFFRPGSRVLGRKKRGAMSQHMMKAGMAALCWQVSLTQRLSLSILHYWHYSSITRYSLGRTTTFESESFQVQQNEGSVLSQTQGSRYSRDPKHGGGREWRRIENHVDENYLECRYVHLERK